MSPVGVSPFCPWKKIMRGIWRLKRATCINSISITTKENGKSWTLLLHHYVMPIPDVLSAVNWKILGYRRAKVLCWLADLKCIL